MDLIVATYESTRDFMELGGWVLYVIGVLLIVVWWIILERTVYLRTEHQSNKQQAIQEWQSRSDLKSWESHRIREQLVSAVSVGLNRNIPLIKACIALCPLLGLLGTVTGMIEVFQVMSINGTSNVRAMAAGVSKATIPTMAGMVAALSCLFFSYWLQSQHDRERELLDETLTFD